MSDNVVQPGELAGGGSEQHPARGFRRLGASVQKAVADKKASVEAAKRKQDDDALAAGALVTRGVFGTSTLEIYEHGFIRVAAHSDGTTASEPKSIGKTTPYERLRSIVFTPSEQESSAGSASGIESAIGPALSGLIKGGTSFMKTTAPGLAVSGIAHTAAKGARVSQLTVATDRTIYQLTNEVHNGLMKIGKKGHDQVGRELAAAGQSVIPASSLAAPNSAPQPGLLPTHFASMTPAPSTSAPTLSERVRELAALHHDGILTADEFASAKAKLLEGL